MIKAKKGNIKFNGLSVELMAEYTGITRGLIQALIEKRGCTREEAVEAVAEAHRIGSMTKEEINKELSEKLWNVLEMAQEELRKEWVEENE